MVGQFFVVGSGGHCIPDAIALSEQQQQQGQQGQLQDKDTASTVSTVSTVSSSSSSSSSIGGGGDEENSEAAVVVVQGEEEEALRLKDRRSEVERVRSLNEKWNEEVWVRACREALPLHRFHALIQVCFILMLLFKY